MFTENELLPISALQHLAFCERQWALVHIERVWAENRLTVEGRHLHERVDMPGTQSRRDVRTARGLPLHSFRLGLVGRADVVEFHRVGSQQTPPTPSGRAPPGVELPGTPGAWQAFPVEYKRGKPKTNDCDRVQLCAQALCLEEMLDTEVPAGALFYGQTRRRLDVTFDEALRTRTESLAARMHVLLRAGQTPPPAYAKRCDRCSLIERCMPKTLERPRPVAVYLGGPARWKEPP